LSEVTDENRASIPLAIFSYIGVELITVTAFEAKEDSRMQLPAKHIAYVVFVIYMISVGGFAANIEWFDQNLPLFEGQSLVNITDPNANLGHIPRHANPLPALHNATAAPIIAVAEAGLKVLPGVLIGFLVYSGVSCANTALYVSSRMLYGLTRNLKYNSDSVLERSFAYLNLVSGTTRVPSWAIALSALIFASWLPFVHLQTSFSQQEVYKIPIMV
jgi:amino acid transporter